MLRPTRAAANGIWRMYEVSENLIDTTWPTATDANFASVTLLCHGDDQEAFAAGPSLSSQHWRNTATTANAAIPLAGGFSGPVISNVVTPKFGSACTKLGGNLGILCAAGASFSYGTGDFTMEGWFYFTSVTGPICFDHRPVGTNGLYPTVYGSSGTLRYLVNSVDRITSAAAAIAINTWYHIALSRVSGNTRLYVAGAQVGSTYVDANSYVAQPPLAIGHNGFTGAGGGQGYGQEFRVTNGVGRYSGATLTVPTTKFADQL